MERMDGLLPGLIPSFSLAARESAKRRTGMTAGRDEADDDWSVFLSLLSDQSSTSRNNIFSNPGLVSSCLIAWIGKGSPLSHRPSVPFPGQRNGQEGIGWEGERDFSSGDWPSITFPFFPSGQSPNHVLLPFLPVPSLGQGTPRRRTG